MSRFPYKIQAIKTDNGAIFTNYYTSMTKRSEWIDRAEKAIKIISDLNIKCGVSILFGLGESHQDRISLFYKLLQWKLKYQSPSIISINWAVQHPLCGDDGGTNYSYIEWSVPSKKWQKVFCHFGEATVVYPLSGQNRPVYSEVKEISALYESLIDNKSNSII